MLDTQNFVGFGKDGRRTKTPIRSIRYWKSWIWEQYLPENMKWKLGTSLKPRNQVTSKPRNHDGEPLPLFKNGFPIIYPKTFFANASLCFIFSKWIWMAKKPELESILLGGD